MGIDARMIVKTKEVVTPEELKKRSYIFGSAFHYNLFLGCEEEIVHHPIEANPEYINEETFFERDYSYFEIPLSGRYYGPDYERGPIFTYIGMAELLEVLFPSCSIYYGGDCGTVFELFDENARNQFRKYFVAANGRDKYNRFFDKENDGIQCPVCDVKMIRTGWGNNFKAFSCLGCGWHHAEKDGVTTKGFLK